MKRTLLLSAAVLLLLTACQPVTTTRQLAKHVVIIGIDGWAAEAVRQAPAEDLPNIHYLMDHGSWTLSKRSVMPSASAINWASMFNGLPTEQHGFYFWNSLKGEIPSVGDNGRGIPPTIFDIMREQRPEAQLGCIYDWNCIGPLADTTVMDHHFFIKTYLQKEVLITPLDYTKLAVEYIVGAKPDMFLFYYGFMDNLGHEYGWYSPEYMAGQKDLDKGIGIILKAIEEAGMMDDTVVILSSDHGGTDKGHGHFTMVELETPLLLYGKNIKEGYEIECPVIQYDTPAIVADILGLDTPAYWRGRPVPEIYQ